ncbi:MAG: RHS repeat-associated core domain-containing protein [Armatimonadota bacterium]|nr:RHS repeat-associated core domain-containing protein [Armatimonadota bacterium]
MRYYHFDALGSTRLLTDSNGNITDEYTSDAWGRLMEHTGSTAQPYQFVGQLGYYTHVQDANLPLLQLGVRFYDPEVGRFTQVDPVDRSPRSFYAYADDSPTFQTDPSGREPVTICGLLTLIYRTATTGYSAGNCLIALYALRECQKCISTAERYAKAMKRYFREKEDGSERYEEWLLRAQPGIECAEICALAGKRGLHAFGGLVCRLLPLCCRAKPL